MTSLTSQSPGSPEPDLIDPLLLDRQLCFAVYSAAHAFTRLYRPMLERLGLTYPQYLVMLVLWQDQGKNGMSIKAIGDLLHLDSGTLTPLLKRLEARGLVARNRDARDERQICIHLSDAGHQLRRRAGTIPQSIGDASGCTRSEREELKAKLIEIRDSLNTKSIS